MTWQWTHNFGRWRRGDNGADDNNNKTTINKCAAVGAEDDNGWQEAGRIDGVGGMTVVRQRRRNSFMIKSWRMEVEDWQVCVHFLFLGGVESFLKSYLDKSYQRPEVFFNLGGWGGVGQDLR
jgi:hypothetical protein